MADGVVTAPLGSGRYLPVGPYDLIAPRGATPNSFVA